MEAPDRLGAGIGITVSLAALSVYLLAHPSVMPPAPDADAPISPLVEFVGTLSGSGSGPSAQAHLLGAVVGAASVGVMYALVRRTRVVRSTALWLTIAFAFGTAHWWAAAAGDATGLAHVLAVLFVLLALTVALDGRWPLVAGLLLGLAATARLPVVLTVPVIMALYLSRPEQTRADDRVIGSGDPPASRRLWLVTAGPLAAGVALPVLALGVVVDSYGLGNAGRHVDVGLLRTWGVVDMPPWLRPDWAGLSVLLTTPLWAWLVRVRSRATAVVWGWVSVGLIAVPTLLSSSVGAPQFGYRPILDAVPVLIVLLAFLFRDGMTLGARLAVVASVAVNAYGMIVVGVMEPPFASG